MLKTVNTPSGFTCEINTDVFDDYELLELISDADDGNYFALGKLVKKILTPEAGAALKEHCRTDDGRVPYDRIGKEITAIFESCGKK